jgi:hypothetical protein
MRCAEQSRAALTIDSDPRIACEQHARHSDRFDYDLSAARPLTVLPRATRSVGSDTECRRRYRPRFLSISMAAATAIATA